MQWIEIVVLALIQGLTEFLPVSSSAHLLLVPLFTDWPDQGLAFDIAVHFGSLLAVIFYFRDDLIKLTRAWVGSIVGSGMNQEARLGWAIIWATVPVGIAGLLAKGIIETSMRSGYFMGYSLIMFGLLLGYADWRYQRKFSANPASANSDEYHLSKTQIAVIGFSQALALIPGTSRSGITITAALLMGVNREASARFSFLLSIPVIVLATMLQSVELVAEPLPVGWGKLLAATAISALSAYLCIRVFLALIRRIGMQPFVLYRLLLGAYLLYCFY
ncbi:undecaprenyl-diphosphate phosphatase [Gilvimarinus agarilyticus]|uniref:undecaprenyl-diphosphate phosphatase n=1 Tax=Gilvimarinus agarilyticus TaxID=679259 RepID=UPI00059F9259|nr:undecaprenyl-diphosphate phosphatase [Gilvimarinus agarilyticus]